MTTFCHRCGNPTGDPHDVACPVGKDAEIARLTADLAAARAEAEAMRGHVEALVAWMAEFRGYLDMCAVRFPVEHERSKAAGKVWDAATAALSKPVCEECGGNGVTLAREQPCGCRLCVCEDEYQCQGCGAGNCDEHNKIGKVGAFKTASYQPCPSCEDGTGRKPGEEASR